MKAFVSVPDLHNFSLQCRSKSIQLSEWHMSWICHRVTLLLALNNFHRPVLLRKINSLLICHCKNKLEAFRASTPNKTNKRIAHQRWHFLNMSIFGRKLIAYFLWEESSRLIIAFQIFKNDKNSQSFSNLSWNQQQWGNLPYRYFYMQCAYTIHDNNTCVHKAVLKHSFKSYLTAELIHINYMFYSLLRAVLFV